MTTRQTETFDCAYSKLEATIRNFSREKFSLESSIAQQSLTIKSYESDNDELRKSIHKLEIEKEEFENVRKQDEECRCSVEAAFIESEKKIDAYHMSLNQFQNLAQGIYGHIETFENIIQTCKYRQVELLSHISTTEETRVIERNTYQNKISHLEKQLATNIELANTKQRELEEEVRNLDLEINTLKLSLAKQKSLFEDSSKAHEIVLNDLRSSHTIQILEKDANLSDVKQKFEEVECELNKILESKNTLLEESAVKIANLEDEICKLKLCVEDEKNKCENASIIHRKEVDDICHERQNLLQEKDDILAAQQKRASEVEDLLNDSLSKMAIEIENKNAQVKKSELEIDELEVSIQNFKKELQDIITENTINALHFENLSNEYQNQIAEKNFAIGDLKCKLAELEKQMKQSLSEANKQCEDYVHEIKKLESTAGEMQITIENFEKGMAEKEDLIVLQTKRIADSEKSFLEVEEQLQVNLKNSKCQIEEMNAKLDDLTSEIQELQLLLKTEKEKSENTTRVHDEFVAASTVELQVRMKEKESEISDLEKKGMEREAFWSNICDNTNLKLELSIKQIKDLETEKTDLQSSLREHEKELQEKCREHSEAIDKLAQANQNEIKAKEDLINELQLKKSQLEEEMNSSTIAAKENLEKSCTKVKELEDEIQVQKNSIGMLNACVAEKLEKVYLVNSMGRTIEDMNRDIEDQRERANGNFKSFQEMSITKENMEEAYREKLFRTRKELHNTREELSKLKVMYENKEQAIAKFLNETKPKISISSSNQVAMKDGQPKLTTDSFMRSDRQTIASEEPCKGSNNTGDENHTIFTVVPPPVDRPSKKIKSCVLKTIQSLKHFNSTLKPKPTSKEPRKSTITKLKQAIRETNSAMDENHKRLSQSQSQSPRSIRTHNNNGSSKTVVAANKSKVISKSIYGKKGILKTTMDNIDNDLEKRNVTFNSPIAIFKSPPEFLDSSTPSSDGPVAADNKQEQPRVTCKRQAPDWMLDPTGKSKKERCSNH